MKIHYPKSHQAHHPPFEILDGGEKTTSYEIPDRLEQIIISLRKTGWAEFESLQIMGWSRSLQFMIRDMWISYEPHSINGRWKNSIMSISL